MVRFFCAVFFWNGDFQRSILYWSNAELTCLIVSLVSASETFAVAAVFIKSASEILLPFPLTIQVCSPLIPELWVRSYAGDSCHSFSGVNKKEKFLL